MEQRLNQRLHQRDIASLVSEGLASPQLLEDLFLLIDNTSDRVAYNALWVFTHLPVSVRRQFLQPRRNLIIDRLLAVSHVGLQRLLLTLLSSLTTNADDLRTDYLDFCLSNINSTSPYAIRALSLKEAYAQCRHFPELLAELRVEISLMDRGPLSPGLLSARRTILRHFS